MIVALQRDVLSVNWPALKSPGLSAETCQHWSGRHLARIGTIPFKEGQGVACALRIQGEAGLSLKLADQGPLLEGVLEK